jgi:hypothetical protein
VKDEHESSREGPIPTGFWVLNEARSKALEPKSLTLWIIRNTDTDLSWVAVETNPDKLTKVITWSGQYQGAPQMVVGAGIEARLTCDAKEGIQTEGEFPGIGSFVETCKLVDGGKRMLCTGKVTTPTGVRTYVEDFDWFGESPHRITALTE